MTKENGLELGDCKTGHEKRMALADEHLLCR
jgi:hypothetical protein